MNEKLIVENAADLKIVEDSNFQKHQITGELSRGGQGIVFKTKNPGILIKIAIEDEKSGKLVKGTTGNKEYMYLRLLPIDPHQHITLPLVILKDYEGYVMRMLGEMETFYDHFGKCIDIENLKTTEWLKNQGEWKDRFTYYFITGGTRRRLEAFLKSGVALASLHAKGLVYCDFSQRNAFISKDKKYCNVWLIDADNLQYEKKALCSYIYTPGLAAPEILQLVAEFVDNIPYGQGIGAGNSFSSDTYSFALCLFQELTFCDPFEGQAYEFALENCEELNDVEVAKENGVFEYIDDESINENDERYNGNSFFDDTVDFTISNELRELFRQTFDTNKGKSFRWLRPTMVEYVMALARSLDTVIECPNCGMAIMRKSNSTEQCAWCDAKLPEILRLNSYYLDENNSKINLWQFERVLENSIEVPLRILHGYLSNEIDDMCFNFSRDSNSYVISLVESRNVSMYLSVDGEDFQKCTSAVLKSKKFVLRIIDQGNNEIYIDGEVE